MKTLLHAVCLLLTILLYYPMAIDGDSQISLVSAHAIQSQID